MDDRKPVYQFLDEHTVEDWAKRISEQAQKGAKLADCGKMCNDCAFKHNQPHDADYLESVDGAVLMLANGGDFHCHTPDGKDAGTLCAGFLYVKEFYDSID